MCIHVYTNIGMLICPFKPHILPSFDNSFHMLLDVTLLLLSRQMRLIMIHLTISIMIKKHLYFVVLLLDPGKTVKRDWSSHIPALFHDISMKPGTHYEITRQ